MKLFDRILFDFNRDGKVDEVETYVGMQMMGSSRRENIVFPEDDYDELDEEIEMVGLDPDELEDMDEDERREVLEEAGLDSDDYEDF